MDRSTKLLTFFYIREILLHILISMASGREQVLGTIEIITGNHIEQYEGGHPYYWKGNEPG